MELMYDVMSLISNFVTIGGTLWLIWGTVLLAGGLKDKSGPQLQQGIWQIVGGAMIIIAAILFSQLTASPETHEFLTSMSSM